MNRHLTNVIIVGSKKLTEMEEAVAEYLEDKDYRKNTEVARKGREKHENRLQKMQEWGNQFGEGQEEQRSLLAYAHYEETFGKAGALREREELHQEMAKSSLASKDNLLAYERQRIEELGKKHSDRIILLKAELDQMSDEEKKRPNPKFVRRYREIGGRAFLETAKQHTGKEKLIDYEQRRLDKYAEKHRKRAEDIERKLDGVSGEERKKPDRAFAEYYYNEMKGKGFFAKDRLIYNHQSGAEILDYEKARLYDRAGKSMEHIHTLEDYKAIYDAAGEDEKKKEAVMKEANRYYESTGTGRLGHLGQRAINIANAASKQDILQYEMGRFSDYQKGGGKGQENFQAVEKALKLLKDGSGMDANGAIAGLGKENKQIWGEYTAWMNGQEDETVKEMVPLQLILNYEESRAPKKARRQKKHEQRRQKLEQAIGLLEDEQNQDIIAEKTEQAKKEYYSGAKNFLKEVKSGKIKDAGLLKDVLERRMEDYGGVHADRLTKLREFMELEEGQSDAALSPRSDAQVWEYYKSIGGGSGFADAFKKQRNGKYSIDDMLRYEQHEARENSKTNAVIAAVSRKVEAKVADYTTSEGGEGVEERRKKEKEGGHYDRYMALKAKWEAGASDAEIVELYLSMGGGNGYVEHLLKGQHFLDVVTPEEILRYEQTYKGKKGEQHRKRLEMLQGLDDTMSEEQVYEAYQASVLENHAMKQFAGKIGISQSLAFDETVKAEEIITPQMIFDYENRRLAQLTEKHREREGRLSGEDVTDENALAIYQSMGGGKGFFNENEEELEAKKEEIGGSHDFEDILEYEQVRSRFYQEIQDEINEPLERIAAARAQLQKQLEEARADQLKIQKYLGESGAKEAFTGPGAFRAFADASSGAEVQNNAAQAEASMERVTAEVEAAQQTVRQIQERIQNER